VRFSLSRYNTPTEVERVLAVLPEILSVLVPEVASGAIGGG
jgi:cysteine sulfinate desulfinase/cysteine desulfurase-like protein